MSDYWSETVRRVGVNSQSATFLEVGPTNMNCVGVYTTNEKSEDYFGKVSIEWSPDLARQIAMAIIACCDEIEKP